MKWAAIHYKTSARITLPLVWLGQSVRTTVVTKRYPELGRECWMISLGDAVHRPKLIERVFCGDLKAHLGVAGPLMLDSGGFTMMMKERSLTVSEIARIYKRAQVELCVALDMPPTSKDRSRIRRQKYENTRANLAYLAEFIGPQRLVPVVHGFTTVEVARNCRQIAEILSELFLICIGGLVPLLRRSGHDSTARARGFAWIGSFVSTVRTYFPRAIIHILGAGSPQNVATAIRCGADSTDSLAWRRAAGFGTIYLPGTGERFVGPRNRKREKSRPILNAYEIEWLAACACPACSEYTQVEKRVARLASSYIARAAHNASVILAEAKRARLNRNEIFSHPTLTLSRLNSGHLTTSDDRR